MFCILTVEHTEEITLQSDVDQHKMSGLISLGIAHMKAVLHFVVLPLVVSDCVPWL